MIKLIALISLFVFVPVNAGIDLPAIGENSSYQLQKEKEIGERFYQRLLSLNKIVDDPLIDFYLNEVTIILLQGLNGNYRDFKVSLIDDDAINAFAVPGGFIGINYGLIFAAQTEAQLAGVLSHEISHVVLNHLSQLLEKQEDSNTAVIASILVALVASQALEGESKNEAVEALVFGSVATAQQSLINFTRENEYEADRKGLELMKVSGYPAYGMAEFFSILEGDGSNSEIASIEYLRTHPVSANRMGEAYQFKTQQLIVKNVTNQEYDFFKVYLNFVVGSDYRIQSNNKKVISYQNALSFISAGHYAVAIVSLSDMYEQGSGGLWVAYTLANLYKQLGRYGQSIAVINRSLEKYPKQPLLLEQKVSVLVISENYDDALVLAKNELDRDNSNQKIRYLLVNIYDHLNEDNKAREVEGDYMFRQGQLLRAKYLYGLVLKNNDDKNNNKILIEKIEKIETLERKKKDMGN